MKEFRTLRGFQSGDEPDDLAPSFRHQAMLRIRSSDTLDFNEIEATLQLEPTTARRRGDRLGPRSPPSKYDFWMFQAPVEEEKDLHVHIDALWTLLEPHADYLRGLKTRATVDVFLGYSSNIDHAGVMIPYRSLEMFMRLELDFGLSIVVVADES